MQGLRLQREGPPYGNELPCQDLDYVQGSSFSLRTNVHEDRLSFSVSLLSSRH
eukprot:34203_3